MRYTFTFFLAFYCFFSVSASSLRADDSAALPYELIEDRALTPLLTPSMQKREIVKLRLMNGLEAYLISDVQAKHSAAALAVKSGSWDDPQTHPGMAHFVEHLLFMGSKAYPEEADFSQYISTHAGNYNAFTATDQTVYMFSVNHEGYPGALDRLAHFFIDPLLSVSSIERELQAVDQEHAKNIEHDGWRQWMILKETGNPDHPHAVFSTGNAETLGSIPQKEVQNWFQKYYTADRMRLVMISPLPKEELIQLAVRDFSAIRAGSKTMASSSSKVTMLSSAQRGHMLYIKPVRHLRELSLIWELPQGLDRGQKQDALSLLSYTLSSEHESGLIDQLKKQKLAQSLRASSLHLGDEETIFSIDVELTDQGLQNPDAVIEQIFATLHLIQNTPASARFDELRQLALLHYQYLARKHAFQTVEEYGRTLFNENLATFPEHGIIPQVFDQGQYSQLLTYFTAENCAFVLTADPTLTEVQPDHKEKWMGAEYTLRPISKEKLAHFQAALPSSTLSLAPANAFIPTHLTLLPSTSPTTQTPEVLWEKEGGRIFYMRDTFYEVPEIAANFHIYSPLLDGSPRASVLSELFCMSFYEILSPTLCMAEAAGLNASLDSDDYYLALSLDGYSEKLPSLAAQICLQLTKIAPSREEYALYHQRLKIALSNASKDMPIIQAKEILVSALVSHSPTLKQKLEAIRKLTYEDFLEFSANLFSKAYFEGMVYGNCSEEGARELASSLEDSLSAKPYPYDAIPHRKVRIFAPNTGPFVISEPTETMGKAAILVIEQGPRYFVTQAAQLVSNAVLHEMFFDSLRTKQQTAYIARAQGREVEGQLQQWFMVQSNTHQPQELLARFELFVEEFLQNFDEHFEEERFETLQSTLIQEYSLPPENFSIMAQRLTNLAFHYDADFQFYPKLVASLNQLDRAHVKRFLEKTLSRKNTRRLAVFIEGKLPPEHDFSYKSLAKEDVHAIGDFETIN